jgi:formylglycine-generating enzyme required for sulfatase activity
VNRALRALPAVLAIVAGLAAGARADWFPGNGWSMSAQSSSVFIATSPVPLSPVNGATGISQAPGLAATLAAGTSTQYEFQMNTAADMTSPLYDFNQAVSSYTANVGAFTGQDGRISVSSDSYLSGSTATFSFYSSPAALLAANTVYYWRVRAQAVSNTGVPGPWSVVSNFTTGQSASVSPINNLAISNVSLASSGSGSTYSVSFTISENNLLNTTTPGGAAYNTADWIFVKYSTNSGAAGSWNHMMLASGGSVASGATLSLGSDAMGAWLDHSATSAYWTTSVTLNLAAAASGVVTPAQLMVKVYAVSMVHIPTGAFVYNAGGVGQAGSNSTSNFNGNTQITVNTPTQSLSGVSGWPNGYNSFYIMRYPVSQGQYADFLNSVPVSTSNARSDTTFLNNGYVMYNNSGVYSPGDRNAAMNRMSLYDLWAFLSWAALRPMTEMEFERAGRDVAPDARAYPWGATIPSTTTPNSMYWALNESTGPVPQNYADWGQVPAATILDVGRYMSSDVYRSTVQAGASPYGIPDLIGNVTHQLINCAFTTIPGNGNGTANWPGTWPVGATSDTTIGAGGSGEGNRGGGWSQANTTVLQLSNRIAIAVGGITRTNAYGGRGARFP